MSELCLQSIPFNVSKPVLGGVRAAVSENLWPRLFARGPLYSVLSCFVCILRVSVPCVSDLCHALRCSVLHYFHFLPLLALL